MFVQERYTPQVVAANTTVPLGNSIAGFVCTSSGTITIVNSVGVTLLSAFPVTGGQIYSFPWYLGTSGKSTFTTAGGAAGVLGV